MKETPTPVPGVLRRTTKPVLVAPAQTDLLNRPAWKPPEIMVRDGGLEYKNWKSKGGD